MSSDFDLSETVGELENMVNAAWDAGYAKGVDWAKKCGGGIDAMTDTELAEHGLVRLPVDADGVPIHVGDTLDGYGKTIEVVELRYGRSGWVLISRDGNGYADTFAFIHHHAPTVEDVLHQFLGECNNAINLGYDEVPQEVFAEYAAKLRLANSEE